MRRLPSIVASLTAVLMIAGTARAADPIFSQGTLHEVRIVIDPAD